MRRAAMMATLLCACGGAAPRDGGSDRAPPDLSPSAVAPDLPAEATDLGIVAADLSTPADLAPARAEDVVIALPGVTVATLAGSAQAGALDGTGAAAQFENPVGLALADDGTLWVTEYDGNRIRGIDSDGVTHTLTTSSGADVFACPFAIAVASATQLVVQTDCDRTGAKHDSSGTLWRIDLASRAATPAVEGLGRPRGLVQLEAGAVAVSDRTAHTLSTLPAGARALSPLAGAAGLAGFLDDTGEAARFADPYGLARLPDGRVLVADQQNQRVRAVTPGGVVSTYAGGATYGSVDGTRAASRFYWPKALAVDAAGDVFVSDAGSHRIRRIAPDGSVVTLAGDGQAGFRDGAGAQAELYGQEGIAVTPDGKRVYVSDGNNGDGSDHHRIRVLTIP